MTSQDENVIQVDANKWIKRIVVFSVAAILLIAAADVFLNHYEWLPWSSVRRSFNITREDSISNWYSSLLTLGVALSALALGTVKQQETLNKDHRGWFIISAFFAYLAIDDATRLHERLGSNVLNSLSDNLVPWFPSYPWQLLFLPLLVAMSLYMLYFFWHRLERKYFMAVVVAIGLLGSAVLLDFVEGLDMNSLSDHASKHFMKLVEECLEMLGMTLLLGTFLKTLFGQIELRIYKLPL